MNCLLNSNWVSIRQEEELFHLRTKTGISYNLKTVGWKLTIRAGGDRRGSRAFF